MTKRPAGPCLNRTGPTLFAIAIVACSALKIEAAHAQRGANFPTAQIGTVRVDGTPTHLLNSFDPDSALGSSIDVLSRTDIDKVFTPHIIQESLSAGWGPLTYRNNTELRMAAWHWTENGTWSDSAHKSGYFTGIPELKQPIFRPMRYPIAASQPAATGHWRDRTSLTGRAIRISPASSQARVMPCTHNGWF